MPKTTTLTIRLDPELKQKTEKLFRDMGLTPSQAITLFYKQVNFERRLPFQISIPNEETLQAIEDSIHGLKLTTVESVDAMFEELEK